MNYNSARSDILKQGHRSLECGSCNLLCRLEENYKWRGRRGRGVRLKAPRCLAGGIYFEEAAYRNRGSHDEEETWPRPEGEALREISNRWGRQVI